MSDWILYVTIGYVSLFSGIIIGIAIKQDIKTLIIRRKK